MKTKFIYISIISIISLITILLFLINNTKHKREIRRIKNLEENIRKEKKILNIYRFHSKPCNIPNLNTPKECYNRSRYRCKWSIEARRCNELN